MIPFSQFDAETRQPIADHLRILPSIEPGDPTDWHSPVNTHTRDMLMMEDSPDGDAAVFSKVREDGGSDGRSDASFEY